MMQMAELLKDLLTFDFYNMGEGELNHEVSNPFFLFFFFLNNVSLSFTSYFYPSLLMILSPVLVSTVVQCGMISEGGEVPSHHCS